MNKILIVDFDDSFTYNIAEICQRSSHKFVVLNYRQVTFELIKDEKYKSIIWGPGPGHPSKYPEVIKLIKSLLYDGIFHYGICLGHQLIFSALGYKIINAPVKRHGISGKFLVPKWPTFSENDWGRELDVQYYSSLAVKDSMLNPNVKRVVEEGVILSGTGDYFLSYQFHPESVGTSFPQAFFRVLREKN
jgi:anthranilate/para-aminobenzoate synthase component II